MNINDFSAEFTKAFEDIKLTEDAAHLADEKVAEIQELFEAFLEAIADAQTTDVQAYFRDLDRVEETAQALSDVMAETGISATFNYMCFGKGTKVYYDTPPGVLGARLADTWLPSSYRC